MLKLVPRLGAGWVNKVAYDDSVSALFASLFLQLLLLNVDCWVTFDYL